MIATSIASTNSAKNSVVFSNSTSCQPTDAKCLPGGEGCSRAIGTLSGGVRIVASEAVVGMVYPTAGPDQRSSRPVMCILARPKPVAPALPDGFARRVLELGLPTALDLRHQRCRQRHVVEFVGHLLPVLERPVEELQDFLAAGRLVLNLLQQDKARCRDRPGILSRRVGDDLVVVLRTFPVGVGGSVLERTVVRLRIRSFLVLHQRIGHVVLLR